MADPDGIGWLRALVVDADDYRALADFWKAVLGVGVAIEEEDWIQLETGRAGVYLAFQPRPEGSGDRSNAGLRVRPDLEVADVDAARTRIEGLGGRLVRVVHEPDGDTHLVMADPEDNEFCILPPLPPELARHFPGIDD